ncbi:MAG: phosphate acyltransferase PlsX [Planctomycetota bacterium]|jgi:glycerol-3-phosphate acyltransferase PlsX
MARIAIDAMGGDHAPRAVVRGTLTAAKEHPEWQLILVGDEDVVQSEISEFGGKTDNVSVVGSDGVIAMHDHPVDALKTMRKASLPTAVKLVKKGEADAVMSAGNTGALVAAATLMLRNLPGVKRAGIASPLPALTGQFVCMDVGANVNAKAQHIAQYAVMGDVFYANVFAKDDHKVHVGLLSVGSEDSKGSSLTKEANSLINQIEHIEFVGNVEGHQIFEGGIDVVVSDGQVGNVMLKTAEGLATIIVKMFAGHAKQSGLLQEDPRFMSAVDYVRGECDWREVGGAALLGVNGTVIISHGRSDEVAIASGIKTAVGCCEAHVNEKIVDALAKQEQTVEAAQD